MAHRIVVDYNAAISDRHEWESRLAEWDDQYYNRVGEKTFPWPGAANFHVPLTMMGVETYKPRLVEAVLGQSPPIIVVPATAGGEERKDQVEAVLNWLAMSKLKLEERVTQSAHLFLHPGTCYIKTTWRVDRVKRCMVREFPAQTPLQAIFDQLFGGQQLKNVEEIGDKMYEAQIYTSPQGGAPLKVFLRLEFLDEPASIQVMVEREEVTEGPEITLPEPIDIFVPAKGGQSPDDVPWMQQRLWMDEDDLRLKARLGRFYADVVEELIRQGPPRGDQPSMDSGLYRQRQDEAEGIEGMGPSNYRRDQWAILEDYRRYDIDGDGFDEEIITWVCPWLGGRILGWDYLDNVYAHGRRPFAVGRFMPIPFRWYGTPFAEMIKGIQDEINTIHNQRVDYATIQNLPFGFKRASATLPPIQQRIRPGEFIDVDNPQQDIFIPKWQGNPAWGQQEEATLMQYNERLSGLTDLSVGRQPNRVGATRTAAGTQTLLSEAGLRFKTALQGFQRMWVRVFEDVLSLCQEYLPPEQEFRITGRQPSVMRVKDRSEIRGKFDLRLASTAEMTNKQRQRDDATMIQQMIMNPMLLQAGLVGLKGVRKASEDLLKAFGRDPSFYLEDKVPVRTPQEELQIFNAGTYISPTAGENLQAHIQAHYEALQSPMVRPDVKKLIQRHIQETIQLLQAQQMAQMQQGAGGGAPPMGQQAMNAQTGRAPQGALAAPEPAVAQPGGAGMAAPMGGGPPRGR